MREEQMKSGSQWQTFLSQRVDVPPAGTVSCVTHDKTMMKEVHKHEVAGKDTGEESTSVSRSERSCPRSDRGVALKGGGGGWRSVKLAEVGWDS